jgi:hypothetical protein
MTLVSGPEIAMVAIIFGTISGTIITVAKTFAARGRPQDPGRIPYGADIDLRLQRIEQAVDAIAIEVERMSESQRFTTKVLAERLPDGRRSLSESSNERG